MTSLVPVKNREMARKLASSLSGKVVDISKVDNLLSFLVENGATECLPYYQINMDKHRWAVLLYDIPNSIEMGYTLPAGDLRHFEIKVLLRPDSKFVIPHSQRASNPVGVVGRVISLRYITEEACTYFLIQWESGCINYYKQESHHLVFL